MRARNIKPGFFTNEQVGQCSLAARLLFIGMWCAADREGYLEERPLRLKAQVFPFDSVDVAPLLEELSAAGLVERLTIKDTAVLFIPTFVEHQRPHMNETPSEFAAAKAVGSTNHGAPQHQPWCKVPPTIGSASTNHGAPHSALNPDLLNAESGILIPDSLNEESGIRNTRAAPAPAHPSSKAIPETPLVAAIVQVFGAPGTESEMRRLAHAHDELLAAGATAEDVETRARRYRERSPGFPLTPKALLNNWSQLATAGPGEEPPDDRPAVERYGGRFAHLFKTGEEEAAS